ncbi:MAG: hypothetical protein U0Q22_10785 [Acidimicrobiales bacterium]
MRSVARFRAHPGAVGAWVGAHAVVWTVVGLVGGLVPFTEVWKAVAIGAFIGLAHAILQWSTTSVMIAEGVLVSRNFGWVRRVEVDQIEVVQRVCHRRWSGVSVRLRGGDEVVLAAPLSSVLAPNPVFEEELRRLCANIAFGVDD